VGRKYLSGRKKKGVKGGDIKVENNPRGGQTLERGNRKDRRKVSFFGKELGGLLQVRGREYCLKGDVGHHQDGSNLERKKMPQ